MIGMCKVIINGDVMLFIMIMSCLFLFFGHAFVITPNYKGILDSKKRVLLETMIS